MDVFNLYFSLVVARILALRCFPVESVYLNFISGFSRLGDKSKHFAPFGPMEGPAKNEWYMKLAIGNAAWPMGVTSAQGGAVHTRMENVSFLDFILPFFRGRVFMHHSTSFVQACLERFLSPLGRATRIELRMGNSSHHRCGKLRHCGKACPGLKDIGLANAKKSHGKVARAPAARAARLPRACRSGSHAGPSLAPWASTSGLPRRQSSAARWRTS